jgi:Mrp family chromosome partitioning ATPase
MSAPLETSSISPVEAFWRFRSWTVAVTIVVGLLAGLAALATSGASTATTTLYLTDPRGTPVFSEGSTNSTDLNRFARQRAAFAESLSVRQDVVDEIDKLRVADSVNGPAAETVKGLKDVIAASATATSDIVVACTASDAARALLVCDLVKNAYVNLTSADTASRAEAVVNAYLADRDRLIADQNANPGVSAIDVIDLKIAEVRSAAALYGSGVEFIDSPEVDENPRLLPAIQFALAGLLFAGFAMAALAWFQARRRPIVVASGDATAALRAPLLGEITDPPESSFDAISPPGVAYQLIATSLSAVHPNGGVVLAGTALPSLGASETVARVAAASAREGRRVVVIDGNLRDRRLSRLFGVEAAAGGLTEMLAGLVTYDDVCHSVCIGGAATLDVVPGGRPLDDASSLFRSQAARDMLASLRQQYDLILIDLPPLLSVADGSALTSEADGVMLMVDRGTESHDLETVRQRLDVLRAPVLGVVFDHRPSAHGSSAAAGRSSLHSPTRRGQDCSASSAAK